MELCIVVVVVARAKAVQMSLTEEWRNCADHMQLGVSSNKPDVHIQA